MNKHILVQMLFFKKYLIPIFKLVFASALILWFIDRGKIDYKLLEELKNPAFLIPCMLLVGFNLLLVSERWRQLLLSQKLQISSWEAFKLTLVGTFFNFAIPGGVGGDVIKAYYIAQKHPDSKFKSITTIGLDRLTGLYCMTLMAVLSMITYYQYVSINLKLKLIFIFLIAILTTFSFVLVILFCQQNILFKKLLKWIDAFKLTKHAADIIRNKLDIQSIRTVFFKTLILSLVSQTATIVFFVLAARALNYDSVPIHIFFFIVPIGLILTSIPITPAGIGVGQAAFYFLFNLIFENAPQLGPTTVTALQIITFLFGVIGAFFYIKLSKTKAVENDSI